MNILVFSWRDPKHPLAGGAEQVMHEHMKGWVEAGHRVTLFSSKVTGLPGRETFDGIEVIRRGDQYLGVKIEGFLYYLKNNNLHFSLTNLYFPFLFLFLITQHGTSLYRWSNLFSIGIFERIHFHQPSL